MAIGDGKSTPVFERGLAPLRQRAMTVWRLRVEAYRIAVATPATTEGRRGIAFDGPLLIVGAVSVPEG